MALTRAFLNSQRYDEAKGNINQTNKTPIVINGDMAVAQRGDQTGKTAACFTAVDRFYFNAINLGTWSLTQDTDNPGFGFAHSLKFNCTTADTSPAAADNLYLSMQTELRNLQMMRKGTASAKTSTVAFWVKCTKTGNFACELWDRPNDRHVVKVVTISSADTWEKKIVNFPADTSGTLSSSNARSVMISWAFDSGTNFTSGTGPTSWDARADVNRFDGTTLALGDSTDNNLFITGVQWEMGTYDSETMPPFHFEDAETNLGRCHRYFNKQVSNAPYSVFTNGFVSNTTTTRCLMRFPEMRALPTLSSGGSFQTIETASSRSVSDIAFDSNSRSFETARIDITTASSNAGAAAMLRASNDTDAFIEADAEM